MAGEIKRAIRLWPNHVTNATGIIAPVGMTTNIWVPRAARLQVASVVDYAGITAEPVPDDVHATPAGKIRLEWFTLDADTSSTLRLLVSASDIQHDTDDLDVAAFDDADLQADDVSNGARKLNRVEVALSSAAVAAGRQIVVRVRRDYSGEAGDTLNAIAYLLGAWLIADQA